ncbi:MAG: peroxidase [Planctomycetota bacterium]|jgi:alkylhydroperoxidase family enzyme|nr:peroxidase [Planctomycetota bacterium]
MAYIPQTEIEAAGGLLKKIYQDSFQRAGRVWNIIKLTGINPKATLAHLGIYGSVMHQDTSLSVRLRETLAVVVSRANHCHY